MNGERGQTLAVSSDNRTFRVYYPQWNLYTIKKRYEGQDICPYSQQTEEEVLRAVRSSRAGLSDKDAAERLKRRGRNTVRNLRRFSFFLRLIAQVKNPVVAILLVSGIFLYGVGYAIDAYIIFAALIINLIIALLQEEKASRAFELLRNADKQYARVLRNGQQIEIVSEEVVPGDIVFLESGEKVPADIRILEENNIQADESVLTGEWMPVKKGKVTLAESTRSLKKLIYSGKEQLLWRGLEWVLSLRRVCGQWWGISPPHCMRKRRKHRFRNRPGGLPAGL